MAIANPTTVPSLAFLNPANWRYQNEESGRDLRLDLLRGFCVFIMIVDHIGGAESWFYNITGGDRFIVSAAEGFLFLSGLTMGVVYAGRITRDGLEAALWQVVQRAWKLYLLTIGMTFIFAAASIGTHMVWAQDGIGNVTDFVVGVLTLHQSYYLTDIALMYTLLILMAPVALILLHKRRPFVVLAGSWLVYLGYQLKPSAFSLPFPEVGVFPLAAWQVLFTTGIVLGYQRKQLAVYLARVPRIPYFAATVALVAFFIALNRHDGALIGHWFPGTDGRAILNVWFYKNDLRPSRLVAFACFFQFFYLLATELWKPLKAGLGWLLIPMGQNSLYAYAIHPFLLILMQFGHPVFPHFDDQIAWMTTLFQTAGILMIWIMIKRRALFTLVPR